MKKSSSGLMISKLSSKNQIVIPTQARTLLGLRSGDEIVLLPKDGTLVLAKKPKSFSKVFAGILDQALSTKMTRQIRKDRENW